MHIVLKGWLVVEGFLWYPFYDNEAPFNNYNGRVKRFYDESEPWKLRTRNSQFTLSMDQQARYRTSGRALDELGYVRHANICTVTVNVNFYSRDVGAGMNKKEFAYTGRENYFDLYRRVSRRRR